MFDGYLVGYINKKKYKEKNHEFLKGIGVSFLFSIIYKVIVVRWKEEGEKKRLNQWCLDFNDSSNRS